MSYEGYERALCAKGHLHEWNCYDSPQIQTGMPRNQWEAEDALVWICPDCGSFAVWWEGVDETNCEGVQTKLVVFVPAEYKTCPCCDNTKKIKEEQYYIPANHGHRMNKIIPLETPLIECETEDG